MEIRKKTIEYSSKKKKEENKIEQELEQEINNLESKPNISEVEKELLASKKSDLVEIRRKRIEGIMIRSKARWTADGEKITKYFCNLEKRHYVSKQMYKLVKDNGEVLFKTDEMLTETRNFYKNLYEEKPNLTLNSEEFFTDSLPRLEEFDSNTLEGLITMEEASDALRNMSNGKSPGTDGITVDFLKFFWKQVGGFVVRSLNEGFLNKQMSITQREGIIIGIPKGDKPREYIRNWRPISLLNVVYKIGSTCIANRIKTVLPKLIHSDQTGFVKGRYIGDNLRLIYDLMHLLDENNCPGLLVSIDFEKAFDSVNWDYMNNVLKTFGFGSDICQWISAFYKNIKSSVVVNGQSSPFFDIKRGCRQGDPISPYLFILCSEILAHRVRSEKQIIGINIAETECKVSQFADDTSFMLKGDKQSYEKLFEILNSFYHLSGLKLNYDKTYNVWLGSLKNNPLKYLNHLNMNWNPYKFKLLGLWFTNDLSDMADINLKDKFSETKKLIDIWMKRTITPIGKIAILKSLILSKLTYLWILLPNPPQHIIDKIQELCYKFVWSDKRDKIKRTLVIHSMEEGGLGLPHIVTQIKSLKLTWLKKYFQSCNTIQNSKPKWMNILEKTCPSVTMLKEYGSKVLLRGTNPNPFWKDVFSCYIEFSSNVEVITSEEMLAEPIFFNDKFKIGDKSIYIKEWAMKDIYFVKDLVKEDGNFLTLQEFSNKTNIDQTSFLLYFGCIDSIKQFLKKRNIIFDNNSTHNKEQGKSYTLVETAQRGAKQFYSILLGKVKSPKTCSKWESLLNREIAWNKVYKKTKKINDVKFKWFQLRINNRILVTNTVLKEMNIVTNNECSFCNNEKDSIFHYLWECNVVQTFWNRLLVYLKDKCDTCTRLTFNPCLILFNDDDKTITDDVFVTILLSAKFFIYKCRINKNIPILDNFLQYFKQIYEIEKFAAYMKMNRQKFSTNWASYMGIVV